MVLLAPQKNKGEKEKKNLMELKQKWVDLAGRMGANDTLIESSWEDIVHNYSHNSRAYHNLDHIKSMLSGMEKFRDELSDPEILEISIWFHDIVYKAGRSDNEKKSAECANKFLRAAGIEPQRIDRCYRQIMSTQTHELAEDTCDFDEKLLLDLDLEVLSRDWEAYLLYTQQIRKEYKKYPWFLYKKGRIKVLSHFLDKMQIYYTEIFQLSEEKIAKSNIKRELAQLLGEKEV